MQHAIDTTEMFLRSFAGRIDMLGNRHIEFDDFDRLIEFSRGALGDREPTSRTGEDDLRAFALGQLGNSEGEGSVSQDACNHEILAGEDSRGRHRPRR